jgi:hypothetical protein
MIKLRNYKFRRARYSVPLLGIYNSESLSQDFQSGKILSKLTQFKHFILCAIKSDYKSCETASGLQIPKSMTWLLLGICNSESLSQDFQSGKILIEKILTKLTQSHYSFPFSRIGLQILWFGFGIANSEEH